MRKPKDPIRLRSREISNGNKSLYLDIYAHGRRRYEYLHLYLVPEKNSKDKQKNRETMQLAKAICAQRIVKYQNGRFGFDSDKQDIRFFDYFVKVIAEKKSSGTNSYKNYEACLQHLKKFCRADTTFRDIDEAFCRDWITHLQTRARKLNTLAPEPLSRNAQHLYWTKFRSVMIKAKKDGIISQNPTERVEGIHKESSERVYLTIEELRAMGRTECHYPIVKRAFLFSCLTGLRKSDVQDLEWGDLSKEGDFWRITFRQIKTGGLVYQDISDEARAYLGEMPDGAAPNDKIFADFHYSDKPNLALRAWAEASGVHKRITYHASRHTFALLLLNQSTDIYTVSRLLGHATVRTTELYAHILDTKKQEAIKSLPKINVAEDEK